MSDKQKIVLGRVGFFVGLAVLVAASLLPVVAGATESNSATGQLWTVFWMGKRTGFHFRYVSFPLWVAFWTAIPGGVAAMIYSAKYVSRLKVIHKL